MKKFLSLLLLILATSCSETPLEQPDVVHNDAIFQYGSKKSFLDKEYIGSLSYGELRKNGDFGLGTFNLIDGEMAACCGEFIQVPTEGEAKPADDNLRTPFAVVKFFQSDSTITLAEPLDIKNLKSIITMAAADTSYPFAVKVTGSFDYVKTRSVHKQDEPFQSLDEIVANQVEFEMQNIEGTIIGFWFPKYMDGVNFPSYHFHFLAKDYKSGGHMLDCRIKSCTVEIDHTDKLILQNIK